MKYKENNIQFNNVLESNFFVGGNGPLTSNKKYRKNSDGSIRHINGDYLVNAIDIHWGGAYVGGQTINTTSELLNYIQHNLSEDVLLEKIQQLLASNAITFDVENNKLKID